MASRLSLHEELCKTLGTRNVYFNPPESIKMTYPAIRYKLNRKLILSANNKNYTKFNSYSVTVIDKNPDSAIPDDLIEKFEMIDYDTCFVKDNLNHYVFTLFY